MKITVEKARDVVLEYVTEMFGKQEKTFLNGLNHVAASCLIRIHFDKAASMLAVNGELDIDLIQEEVNKELPALLSEPLRAVGMEYRFTETDVQNLFAKLRQYGSKENG